MKAKIQEARVKKHAKEQQKLELENERETLKGKIADKKN